MPLKSPHSQKTMHSNASARMPTSTTFNLEIQEPPANDQLTTTSSHYESNRSRFRNQNLDKKVAHYALPLEGRIK